MIEEYYISNIFKINEKDLKKAIAILAQKWQKVVDDSDEAINQKRDASEYRKLYRDAYKHLIPVLIESQTRQDIENLLLEVNKEKKELAVVDAHAYACLELSALLKNTNEG
jgi:hypothetical protein